jgi:hypothetical protein
MTGDEKHESIDKTTTQPEIMEEEEKELQEETERHV